MRRPPPLNGFVASAKPPNFPRKLCAWLVLGLVAGDILFTAGFMLLRIPPVGFGVPINQITLVAAFLLLAFSTSGLNGLTSTAVFWILYNLWVLAAVQIVIGIDRHGAWAIRDAANIIESTFFIIGFWLACDPGFRWVLHRWISSTLIFATIYILTYPAKDYLAQFSPTMSGISGYTLPFFFHFGNPASIGVTSIFYLLVMRGMPTVYRLTLATAMVTCLLVFVQARIAYLQLVYMIVLLLLFDRRSVTDLLKVGLIAFVLMTLFIISGIQLPGRLGQSFNYQFMLSHIQAIWGGGGAETKDAADGVGLRLEWWTEIFQNQLRNLPTWLFGQGYGIALTTFRGEADDLVREPHNSYVSIYARLGFVGITLFAAYIGCVMLATLRLVQDARALRDHPLFTLGLTALCFFGVHLIYAMGEGGFEISFISVPFQVLAGMIYAISLSTRNVICNR